MVKIDRQKLLLSLNEKFSENLSLCLPLAQEAYARVEVKARSFAVLGQIIREDINLTPNQREILPIFEEVFADVVLSIYFAGCALNRPAESILRRALELGIAIVYLWDLPDEFWGWKAHDKDLNFNEMLEHLTRDCYRTYIKSLDTTYSGEDMFDEKETKRLYRTLSNTIHGKINTHIAQVPNRFKHDAAAWETNLDLIERVLIVLMDLSSKRFFKYFPKLQGKVPALSQRSKP